MIEGGENIRSSSLLVIYESHDVECRLYTVPQIMTHDGGCAIYTVDFQQKIVYFPSGPYIFPQHHIFY